jgi:hypothetical protein
MTNQACWDSLECLIQANEEINILAHINDINDNFINWKSAINLNLLHLAKKWYAIWKLEHL